MNSDLERRLKAILKKKITPLLNEYKFKKHSWSYYRNSGSVTSVIFFQKSKWNGDVEFQFTFNVGVFVREVMPCYMNIKEPKNPKIENCSLYTRVGNRANQEEDTWWELNATDCVHIDLEIGENLEQNILNSAIPFLERFSDIDYLADYLSSGKEKINDNCLPVTNMQRQGYASIIYSMLQEKEKARKAFNSFSEMAQGTGHEVVINRIDDYLKIKN